MVESLNDSEQDQRKGLAAGFTPAARPGRFLEPGAALAFQSRAGSLSVCLNLSHFCLGDKRVTLPVGPEELRIAWEAERPAALPPLCVCGVAEGGTCPAPLRRGQLLLASLGHG